MSRAIFTLRTFSCKITLFLIGIWALPVSQAKAQGDLLISPLRIVIEGSKKSQEINLANVGKDTATYVISVQNIKMNEDGSFEQITQPEPGQNFADTFFRLFPRKVV